MKNLAEEVTIVIINYNGEQYIRDCLSSVFEAKIFNSSVLLIDNNSQDKSLEIVRKEFPQVRIIKLDKNYGAAKARNVGIQQSKTKWVLLLDVDTVVTKDLLRNLFEGIRNFQNIGIAASRVLFYNNREIVNSEGGGFAHYIGMMVLKNGFSHIKETKAETGEIGAAGAISMLVERDKAIEAGLFDEDFFVYLEDFDFSLRMRLRGYKILSVPTSVVYHREGTSELSYREGRSYPKNNAFLHIRNRLILILKIYSLKSILLFFPAFLLYELALFVATLKKGLFIPYLNAWIWILTHLYNIFKKRKLVQSTRSIPDRELFTACKMVFPPGVVKGRMEEFFKKLLDNLLCGYWKIIKRFL
jgi:GT2 family glycosyltransferase